MSNMAEQEAIARSIVQTLERKGIKLLALDFDKTIVSVHTLGHWRQGTPQLTEHVRPCFKALIKEALLSSCIQVCVVTYSMQPTLIHDVLKMALPGSDISQVIIRANSKDWLPQTSVTSSSLGKQQHIAWIVTEMYDKKHVIIQPHEIMLMDDDNENINLALEFGHQAFEVGEEVTLETIDRYVQTLDVKKREDIAISEIADT